MMDTTNFFTTPSIVAIGLAAVPSIIAWIRLGPRVDRNERELAAQTAELRKASECLVKLTTLQEVAERRLERLENK